MQSLEWNHARESDASESGSESSLYSQECSTPASETTKSSISRSPDLEGLTQCLFPTSCTEISTAPWNFSLRVFEQGSTTLHDRCQRSGFSPATILQAGWLFVLQNYTGQASVSFDLVSSNKPGRSTLSYKLTPEQTIIEVLTQLQGVYHQDSLKRDVVAPTANRGLKHSPRQLCNTAFDVENESKRIQSAYKGSYDIILGLSRADEVDSSFLTCKKSAITERQAKRITSTLREILQSILTSLEHSAASIRCLSVEDRCQILRWNKIRHPTLNQHLHHIFSEKALDNPDSLAVSAWDGELTYAELDEASTRLAGLIHSTIGPNHTASIMIPLIFDKSKYAIITTLAILKAGAVCVPLDSSATDSELQQKLLHVDSRLVCVSERNKTRVEAFAVKLITVNSSLFESLYEMNNNFEPNGRQSNVAFVEYSAGNTGEQKCAILSHAALYTGILAHGRALGYDENSRILQCAPYTSSISVADMFGAFLYDACLVIATEDQISDNLTDTINNEEVTHACLTPDQAKTIRLNEASPSKLVIYGGQWEMLGTERADFAGDLVNGYGTAETSVFCTTSRASTSKSANVSCIGTSFVTSTWIIDPENINTLCPIGGIGELVVSGPTLADGYLNNKPATADAFFTNPAWLGVGKEITQQRFFRTGDLAKYLDDGELVLCGRKHDGLGL